VILDAADTDGILNDASEEGVALDIVGPQPQGEYIAVDFEMSEIGQRFEAKGRIMWRGDDGKKVGVHFVDLPEASRDQIRKWLAKKAPTSSAPPLDILGAAPEPQNSVVPTVPADLGEIPPAATSPISIVAPSNLEHSKTKTPPGPPAEIPATPTSPPQSAAKIIGPNEIERDRLVQNLLDSFSQSASSSRAIEIKPHVPVMFSASQGISSGGGRRWVTLTIAAGLLLLLALAFIAYRSPAGNAEGINVSKVGLPPVAEAEVLKPGGSPPDGGNPGEAVIKDAAGNNRTGTPKPSATVPFPALPGGSASGHPPCVHLGPPSDKVRLYLWIEQGTPAPIVSTYLKNLDAVQDVRVVNQPPYDLVLYVNGATVDAKGPGAGYLWSSRVFRPWYCGEALGQLEQTEVNESLHYVQGAHLDQRVQAEVAYLILHTFESIRNEGEK
jgi:PilZ domain